jgi:ATP-binding cassette subfamily C protein CydC
MTIAVMAIAWPTLDATVVTLLALMTLGLNEALGTLPGAFWRIGESDQAARHLMQLEHDNDQGQSSEQPHVAPPEPSDIQIINLVCQRQPFAHQQLNQTLRPGQPLVVHGASGSGKSSLLATLAGELQATHGQLLIGETDALSLADAQRYRLIGFLSQNDVLLDLSIGEFLRLGQPSVSDHELREALDAVDLLQTLEKTPQGLDYRLGVGGARISGGQARRLQLAALLLHNPALVLLDEPFRGLQPELVQTILKRTAPWFGQRCAIIVTHDPQALPEQWPRLRWPH